MKSISMCLFVCDIMKKYILILIVASSMLLSVFVAGCSSTTKPSPSPTPAISPMATNPSKTIATATPIYTPSYTPTYTPANSIPTVAPAVTQIPSISIQ